jgi:hypothetical protein
MNLRAKLHERGKKHAWHALHLGFVYASAAFIMENLFMKLIKLACIL